MFKIVDTYSQRSLYVALILMVFVAVDRISHIPSSSWIIFLGCSVYVGFDSGAVVKRSQLLFFGTILGLICAMSLTRFIYWNYDLTSAGLVLSMSAVLFFTAIPFYRLVILVTILSDLLMQRLDSQLVNIKYCSINRFMCLIVIFIICVLFEYFWFGRNNTTYLNYLALRDFLRKDLVEFSMLLQQEKFTVSNIYRKIQNFLSKVARLNTLVNSLLYEKSYASSLSEEDKKYNEKLIEDFRAILGIYYIKIHHLNDISDDVLEKKISGIMEGI